MRVKFDPSYSFGLPRYFWVLLLISWVFGFPDQVRHWVSVPGRSIAHDEGEYVPISDVLGPKQVPKDTTVRRVKALSQYPNE